MNPVEKEMKVKDLAIQFSVNKSIDWTYAVQGTMGIVGCSYDQAVRLLGTQIKELHE